MKPDAFSPMYLTQSSHRLYEHGTWGCQSQKTELFIFVGNAYIHTVLSSLIEAVASIRAKWLEMEL